MPEENTLSERMPKIQKHSNGTHLGDTRAQNRKVSRRERMGYNTKRMAFIMQVLQDHV